MQRPALSLIGTNDGSRHIEADERRALEIEARGHGFVIDGDEAMADAYHQMKVYAASSKTVLLRGDTGTGKEPSARVLHKLKYNGSSRDNQFFDMNCASVSEGVFESELFGHKKGSFTNAIADHTGAFGTIENGGTLFLDEIGDMPLPQQAKLLRVLEERSFRPVGHSGAPTQFKGRVVCATSRPLEDLVRQKKFRPDLYQRITAAQIALPLLADRTTEHKKALIEFLSLHIPDARPGVKLTSDALRMLTSMEFPGNVRGLKNFLERAYLQAAAEQLDGPVTIDARHVAWAESPVMASQDLVRTRVGKTISMMGGDMVVTYPPAEDHEGRVRIDLKIGIKDSQTALPRDMTTVMNVMRSVLAAEVQERNGGNQSVTAKALGITRGSLRKIMAEGSVMEKVEVTKESEEVL